MKGFSVLAILSFVGLSIGQGVTDKIPPKGAAPDGCKAVFDGLFQVTVEDVTTVNAKRDLGRYKKRGGQCAADGTLVVSLADGVLTDAKSRTGYIASNRQFQFDAPPQAGAIYTAGFSVCGNNSLALGSSAVFYECLSGDFYNLYDESWAPQCSPVEIVAIPCGGPDPPYASQIPDGQVVGTTVVATTVVIPLSDGQPQVITTSVPVPLCQIGDGQVQGKTVPCASITAKPTSAPVPVSQYSDGQIQVTPPGTGAPPPPATTPTAAPPPPPASSVVSSAAPPPPPSGKNATSTLAKSTTAAPPTTTAATSTPPPTSAPANGAGNLQMSSLAALVVGIVGAVCFL